MKIVVLLVLFVVLVTIANAVPVKMKTKPTTTQQPEVETTIANTVPDNQQELSLTTPVKMETESTTTNQPEVETTIANAVPDNQQELSLRIPVKMKTKPITTHQPAVETTEAKNEKTITSVKPQPLETSSESHSKVDLKLEADPKDCKHFISINKEGRKFRLECAPGTLFNKSTLTCDHKYLVKC